jgi:hypothetical protein
MWAILPELLLLLLLLAPDDDVSGSSANVRCTCCSSSGIPAMDAMACSRQ